MSNTKWRIVFETLWTPQLDIRQIVVKFIDVEEAKRMGLPRTKAPHDFVDSIAFGPFPIVGIEWIEVPEKARFDVGKGIPAKLLVQDIDSVRAALERTGKLFPMSDGETGLRISGHVR